MTSKGYKVYFSEYSAPSEFTEVWSKLVKFKSTINGDNKNNKRLEKLFTYDRCKIY